jgi:hypothetical protein
MFVLVSHHEDKELELASPTKEVILYCGLIFIYLH